MHFEWTTFWFPFKAHQIASEVAIWIVCTLVPDLVVLSEVGACNSKYLTVNVWPSQGRMNANTGVFILNSCPITNMAQ